MKKIFGQVRQFVSKYRKRLVYWALALFIGQLCFFNLWWIGVENCVFAADDSQTQDQRITGKLTEWKASLSMIEEFIYILIYPCLVLAWKLVDNSLVYWEVFGFDAVLWQLWNIVKNLANFTLWFIFIFKIFRYLINWKEKVKDIILRALIAWIWIQASWFLMSALVDMSTILTYSIWWMPISVLKQSEKTENKEEKFNPYILKNVVNIDVKALDIKYKYMTNVTVWDKKSGDFYISECYTFFYEHTGSTKEKIILAPEMVYYKSNAWSYIPTDANRCHLGGQIYYFGPSLYNGEQGKGSLTQYVVSDKFSAEEINKSATGRQNAYKEALNTATVEIIKLPWGEVWKLIEKWTLLEIWDAHASGGISPTNWSIVYAPEDHRWWDKNNEWTWTGWKTSKLQDILNDDSYIWVFTALYSSLMNAKENTISQLWTGGPFLDVLNVAFSLWYLLAVAIPLIVVALVFMMRIGILRLAIALSPFIVLFVAFDLFKADSIKKIKFLEYFDLENLIQIIFSPALVCFAISISTVLFTVIQQLNLNLEEVKGEIIWWLISVKISWIPMGISQLITSILWVAITWFIVRAAVEASKLWKSGVVKSLKDLATSALWSMPIVPVPGKDWEVHMMGASTVFGWNDQKGIISKMSDEVKRQYDAESNDAIRQFVDPEAAEAKAKKDQLSTYTKGLKDLPADKIDWTWTNMPIPIWKNGHSMTFEKFSTDEQESIIREINGIDDEEKRKKFWESKNQILVWDKTYKFVTTRNKEDGSVENVYKYEEQKSS